jgi:molybdopterin converting factor small subunit
MSREANEVIVEFYGIPRQRAGRAELLLSPGTVAELLAQVQEHCPGLRGLVDDQGQVSKEFLLSIDGERFVVDLNERLKPGARVLILSADAGG